MKATGACQRVLGGAWEVPGRLLGGPWRGAGIVFGCVPGKFARRFTVPGSGKAGERAGSTCAIDVRHEFRLRV